MKRVMVGVNFGMLALIFVFLSALGGRDVSGATFCVTNATELQDALTAAQNNGQDDTIQVVQGTYTGNFAYTAALTENYMLTLQGGFTDGCASRVVDTANTILDGQNVGRVLTLTAGGGNLGARVAIDGFTIKNGLTDGDGRGVYVNLPSPIGGTITITNNTISGNSCGYYGSGGGVYATSNGTTTINNNTIIWNSSGGYYDGGGGGVYAAGNGTTTITGNTIIGNGVSGYHGGGVFSSGTSAFYNNIIAGNAAGAYGGGVYATNSASQSSVITLTNNTVAMNVAGYDGGGLFIGLSHDNASAGVYNNIIYGNYGGGQWGYDIFNNSDADGNGTEAAVDICYNDFTTLSGALPLDTCVPGCGDVPNRGNISADPLFVDPVGLNFHLQCSLSPCVDAGCNSAPGIPSEDMDGEPRIQNGVVDMGADECTTPCPSLLSKICHTCPPKFIVKQGKTKCKTFKVWNCGKGTLNWTVSEDCDWLTLSPPSGTSTGKKNKVEACVDTTGLDKGDYECTVTITGECATNSPQTCVIRLKVR